MFPNCPTAPCPVVMKSGKPLRCFNQCEDVKCPISRRDRATHVGSLCLSGPICAQSHREIWTFNRTSRWPKRPRRFSQISSATDEVQLNGYENIQNDFGIRRKKNQAVSHATWRRREDCCLGYRQWQFAARSWTFSSSDHFLRTQETEWSRARNQGQQQPVRKMGTEDGLHKNELFGQCGRVPPAFGVQFNGHGTVVTDHVVLGRTAQDRFSFPRSRRSLTYGSANGWPLSDGACPA